MSNNSGWFGEPQRHRLSRYGIKTTPQTTQKKLSSFPSVTTNVEPTINWDLTTTELGAFDDSIKHFDSPYRNFDVELRWVTPDEYIELQEQSISRFMRDSNRPIVTSPHEMFIHGYFPDHGEKVKEWMLSGDKIPCFVVEIDDHGVTSFQEGRHRIMVAKELGLEKVPVWFCTRRY
jgi:hypothetical protein